MCEVIGIHSEFTGDISDDSIAGQCVVTIRDINTSNKRIKGIGYKYFVMHSSAKIELFTSEEGFEIPKMDASIAEFLNVLTRQHPSPEI